jgi:pimeloyl-ACP methyl ester carboxylesterase
MNIPFINFGGSGEELVFLHANGYPPKCYRPLLSRLAERYHVAALAQRPLWPGSRPDEIDDWRPLTDDFLKFLDSHMPARFDGAQRTPLVCVGHSMGGIVLLRAALREPERFKAIVLLDPVLFPPYFITLWRVTRALKLGQHFHPLVVGARQRRQQFDNLERLYTGYRRKSVFRYMDDESLRAYVEGIACQREDGGYRLCYSADWEIRIYLTGIWRDMDIWRGLPQLKVRAMIVRGAETDTFWERTGTLVKRKQPGVRVETLAGSTHLLPLERPKELTKLIQSFFKENA